MEIREKIDAATTSAEDQALLDDLNENNIKAMNQTIAQLETLFEEGDLDSVTAVLPVLSVSFLL